jgi:hypothetical protein
MGNQITHLGLEDLVNAVSNERSHDELLEIVREDILSSVRGHYPMELRELEEKTRHDVDAEHREQVELDAQVTFNVALARRVAELMPGLEEQAQAKARASAKSFMSKYNDAAMDMAKHEAEERAKAHGKEHYATRAVALKLHWDQVIANEEVDMVRTAAIALGISPEVDPACVPRPAKKQRGEPRSVTAAKATEELRDRAAGPSGEKRKLDAPAVPALRVLMVPPTAPLTRPDQAVEDDPEPSSCPLAAEEDVSMRVLSLPPPELDASYLSDAHMDPSTRGVASSMHCPDNVMADDVVATSGLGLSDAADDGAAPSPTDSAPPSLHILDSTQDRAVVAMWQILSKQVDRRCAAMEAKVAAALSRLPGPSTGAPPPRFRPCLHPGPRLCASPFPLRCVLPRRQPGLRLDSLPPLLRPRSLRQEAPPHPPPLLPRVSTTTRPSPPWSRRVSGRPSAPGATSPRFRLQGWSVNPSTSPRPPCCINKRPRPSRGTHRRCRATPLPGVLAATTRHAPSPRTPQR